MLKQKLYGNTLLHEAVNCGNLKTIETILVYTQQLDIFDFMFEINNYGWTPLDRAFIKNTSKLLKVISLFRQYAESCGIDFDALERASRERIEQ